MQGSQQLFAEEPGQVSDPAQGYRIIHAVTPLRRWRVPLLRFAFRLGRAFPVIEKAIPEMKVIHLARWSIVERVPSRDRPGAWQRLRRPCLLFESNFDGPWEPYIEDFARVMPIQWRLIWGGAIAFPGPLPVTGLLAYITAHDCRAEHYYSAHAHETLEGTLAALELEPRLKQFAAATRDLTPDEFHEQWSEFLTDVQELL